MRLPPHLPLFWTICLINGVVFVLGTVVLVLSPASVSRDALLSEVAVVAVGLVAILLLNALLIRWALAPLTRLIARVGDIERLEPTLLPEEGSGPVRGVAQGVNALLARLADDGWLESRQERVQRPRGEVRRLHQIVAVPPAPRGLQEGQQRLRRRPGESLHALILHM